MNMLSLRDSHFLACISRGHICGWFGGLVEASAQYQQFSPSHLRWGHFSWSCAFHWPLLVTSGRVKEQHLATPVAPVKWWPKIGNPISQILTVYPMKFISHSQWWWFWLSIAFLITTTGERRMSKHVKSLDLFLNPSSEPPKKDKKRIGAHPMVINSVYLLNASDLPQSGTVIQAVSGIPCKVSTGQHWTLLYHTVSNLQASKSPSGVVPDL